MSSIDDDWSIVLFFHFFIAFICKVTVDEAGNQKLINDGDGISGSVDDEQEDEFDEKELKNINIEDLKACKLFLKIIFAYLCL